MPDPKTQQPNPTTESKNRDRSNGCFFSLRRRAAARGISFFLRKIHSSRRGAEEIKCQTSRKPGSSFLPRFSKARSYISRREVKVFGAEIFLYE
jgi:hypothetical protein